MLLAVGTVVAERFRLERPLGEGAMGSVWLAQHTQLDIPCAVKFILGEGATNPDLRGRFEREAKAAAGLRSPHVVGILDHGVWNDIPYIAMEYLEGEDLSGRLARLGRMAPGDVVNIVAQVSRALTKAHAAGLVHRDLKPANIFLAHDDDREIAKVLDFGIAKASGVGIKDAGTKTGALMGTPYFMSPEQVQGTRALDHRSDLWSLAVVVFQCVTGGLPFESEALGDLFLKIMINPLPIPSQVAPLPASFDAWWARAAARDPAGRFQTAKEFAESLATALGVAISQGASLGASSARAALPAPNPVPAARGAAPGHSGTVGLSASGAPHPGSSSPGIPAVTPSANQPPHAFGQSPQHAFGQSPSALPPPPPQAKTPPAPPLSPPAPVMQPAFGQSPSVVHPFGQLPPAQPAGAPAQHPFAQSPPAQPPGAPAHPPPGLIPLGSSAPPALSGSWSGSLAGTAGAAAEAVPRRKPIGLIVGIAGAAVALVAGILWATAGGSSAGPAAASSGTTEASAVSAARAAPSAAASATAAAPEPSAAAAASAVASAEEPATAPSHATPAPAVAPRGPTHQPGRPGSSPQPKSKELVRW